MEKMQNLAACSKLDSKLSKSSQKARKSEKMKSLQIQSFKKLPPIFDMTDSAVQVMTYNTNLSPAVKTFSSIVLDLESGVLPAVSLESFSDQSDQYKEVVKNEEGVPFYQTKSLTALQIDAQHAYGYDAVAMATEQSPIRFPQRLMVDASFELQCRARRLFYAQKLKKRVNSKRVEEAYENFQPVYYQLRETTLNDVVDVFFYLPLSDTGNTCYILVVDAEGKVTVMKDTIRCNSLTFTSNWSVYLERVPLVQVEQYGSQCLGEYDMAVKFALTNLALDVDENVHFICCQSTLSWPNLFTVECTECSVNTGGSMYCNNRNASCYAKDELWELSEQEKELRMAAIRRVNEAYNRSMEKFHIDKIVFTSVLLSNERSFDFFDADTVLLKDAVLCRLGTTLYKIRMRLEDGAESSKVSSYEVPMASNMLRCSTFLDNEGSFAFVTKDGDFYVSTFSHVEDRPEAFELKPKLRNVVPPACMSSVRLFRLSLKDNVLIIYYHDGSAHYMLNINESLLEVV